MQIDIELPHPKRLILFIGGVVAFLFWFQGGVQGMGGSGEATAALTVRMVEEDVRDLRQEQAVLERREEILRAELDALEREERLSSDPALLLEIRETRARLVGLLQDKRQAEKEILLSLQQIWAAQAVARSASRPVLDIAPPKFTWPVEPLLGISAYFGDTAYEKRFGLAHRAIDIPIEQGSVVRAAADGVVLQAQDNGLGYNALILQHRGGYATLYGHVSSFLVKEGQVVKAGDPVALSGGRPGTAGAGRLTTGSHLHFEMLEAGKQVDPLRLLPQTGDR